jgi:hypothetical protein
MSGWQWRSISLLIVSCALMPITAAFQLAHRGSLATFTLAAPAAPIQRGRTLEMRKGTMLANPGQWKYIRKLAQTDATIQRPTIPSAQQHAQVVEIQIPEGFAPGDVMQIAFGGVEFEVQVPATCAHGDVLRVTVPAVEQEEASPLALDCDGDKDEDEGCDTVSAQTSEEAATQEEPHCCYGRMYVKGDDAVEEP